jgi:hypothetical protein
MYWSIVEFPTFGQYDKFFAGFHGVVGRNLVHYEATAQPSGSVLVTTKFKVG